MRRSAQSELLRRPESRVFHPSPEWTRLSFLDLIGEGDSPALDALEPAYVDGETLIAVWPAEGDIEAVQVMVWGPDTATLEQLQALQVDWPAALCDVRVRVDAGGRVELEPCRRSFARKAAQSRTDCAARVCGVLERGARALGRAVLIGE